MDLFEWGKSTAALSSQAQCQTGLSSEHLENISARKAIDEIAPTLVNPFSWVSAAGYPSFTNYTVNLLSH